MPITTKKLVDLLGQLSTDIELAGTRGLDGWTDAWRYPGGTPALVSEITTARATINPTGAERFRKISNNNRPLVQVIERLWLRQIPVPRICEILHLESSVLTEFLDRTQRGEDDGARTAQVVWSDHCQGRTVQEIHTARGTPRSYIYRVLNKEGAEPNRTRAVPPDDAVDRRLADLYRRGYTYDEISERVGMSLASVKRALKRLSDNGHLPEYGQRPGGRPPKENIQ